MAGQFHDRCLAGSGVFKQADKRMSKAVEGQLMLLSTALPRTDSASCRTPLAFRRWANCLHMPITDLSAKTILCALE